MIPFAISFIVGDMEESHCAKYFAGIYLIISVVVSNLEDTEEEDYDDDEEEERKPAVIILNVLDNCENFFAEFLYEQEVCQTYLESFKNVSHSIYKISILIDDATQGMSWTLPFFAILHLFSIQYSAKKTNIFVISKKIYAMTFLFLAALSVRFSFNSGMMSHRSFFDCLLN